MGFRRFGAPIARRRSNLPVVRKFSNQKEYLKEMSTVILRFYAKGQVIWNNLKDEKGQDLVEYAAVIVLVVLALTGGM